jgi:hypothetical protein
VIISSFPRYFARPPISVIPAKARIQVVDQPTDRWIPARASLGRNDEDWNPRPLLSRPSFGNKVPAAREKLIETMS